MKRVVVAVVLCALGFAFSLAAPMAANAATTTTYPLDCSTITNNSGLFYVKPGNSVTFDPITGFNTMSFNGTISTLNPGDTVEAFSGDVVTFGNLPATTCSTYFDARVMDASPETVPSGSLLSTQNMSLSSSASEITLSDNSGGSNLHYLNGDPDCALSTGVHGIHVYSTLDVTILASGTFTFRGLYSTPTGYYIGPGSFDPIGDPVLAVYSSFDPVNPDNGVVGCNNNASSIGAQNDAEYLSDGSIIEGHQPYVTAALAPGRYTLVLLTYDDLSDADLLAGYDQFESANFVVGTKQATFQLWGPLNSLALQSSPSAAPGLAATGLGSLDTFWVGLTGLFAGSALIVLGRRRTVRD